MASSSSSSVKEIQTSDMVVAAHNLGRRDGAASTITYRRHEDKEWTTLDCGGGKTCTYYDVAFCEKKKTLFALGEGASVEAWDLKQTIPKKTTIFQGPCPKTLEQAHLRFPTNLYVSHPYLASTPLGQLFLVVFYVAESLKTVNFLGFRLDLDRREWVEVKKCNFAALFKGGNGNLIKERGEVVYYSNDYWETSDGFSNKTLYEMAEDRVRKTIKEEEYQLLVFFEKSFFEKIK